MTDHLREFEASMDTITSDGGVPGISVAVTSHQRLLYARGFGYADLNDQRSTSAQTTYLWFSMTKIATATAAMRLVDDGALDLAAPVAEYVPGYPSDSDERVEVGQLLDHTAGVANPVPVRWVRPAARPEPDPGEFLRARLARHGHPKYEVGGAARYSNLGYLILGEVIASAADQPFEDYLRQSVLRPAGMQRTDFAYGESGDRAVGYVRAPLGSGLALKVMLPSGIVGRRQGRYLSFEPFLVDGAAYGGLVGDAVDASRLAALHLGDGELDGQHVLLPETARGMRDIRTAGKPFDLGQGWFRRPVHRDFHPEYVEHWGSGGGFFNAMRLYPDLDLGIVLMTNRTAKLDVHHLFELLRTVRWEDAGT